jgi:tRNA nucleotidyltransferase (CCA-adding enzyme)
MAPSAQVICNKVKLMLQPGRQHQAKVKELVILIKKLLKDKSLKADCVVGGSFAKGTNLKGSFDVDLFVRFDTSLKDKDISRLLESAIKRLNPVKVHGSRDYFQVRRGKLLLELIPVLKISGYKQAVNVTDMSPMHVDYALRHFQAKKGLSDEARLAKQFCKSIGAYGAESYIRGFSGHAIDLLIIYYGSFLSLLMQASVWGEKVVIDIERHLKDPVLQLNKAKAESPLVLVDPLQPVRNASAALSMEKYELFKAMARSFLENPSMDFFRIKPITIQVIMKKAGRGKALIACAVPLRGKDDVAGSKVLKVYEYLLRLLEKEGFKVVNSGWGFNDKSLLYFVVEKDALPTQVVIQGPPTDKPKFCASFRQKHKEVFEKNSRLCARAFRKYTSARKLLLDAVKHEFVRERVRKISILK